MDGEYAISRNPPPKTDQHVTSGLTDWSLVLGDFTKWLEDVNKMVNDSASTAKKRKSESVMEYEDMPVTIHDSQKTNASFGVGKLADQIVTVIDNLQSESGNMIGVFGRWGRGKTRLMNEISERLKRRQTIYISASKISSLEVSRHASQLGISI